MLPMIVFFTATVTVAYMIYQYKHQHVASGPQGVTDKVAGVVTEGMMKLAPEPIKLDSSVDIDQAKEVLYPPQSSDDDGLQQLKALVESWQQIASDPRYQKQPTPASITTMDAIADTYKGSHCEMLDIKLASMISSTGSNGGNVHKSPLINSLPDGYRDIVIDMISHLEAQPGVSPAKILASHAARTFHANKIPGITSWTDESICKLLYWEIIAAEKYIKWKDWLSFHNPKKK